MDAAKNLLIRAVTSLKVWTAIIGILSTWLAKRGIIIGQDLAPYVAGFFAVLLGAQGLTDHGKEKAKIEGDTAITIAEITESAPSSSALSTAPVANQVVVVEDKADAAKVVVEGVQP